MKFIPFMKNKKGFVLILVLLIVALLMAMVVDFAYGIYVDMNGLNNLRVLERLSLECSSLIQSASGLLPQGISSGVIVPGAPEMEVPIEGNVKVYFRLEDESAKYNLNMLSLDEEYYNSFKNLLNILGLDEGIADKIVDWIDTDSKQKPLGNEKGAKNAPLESISELKLFIDPVSYAKLEPYVTIYTSEGIINVNTASLPVLMSLMREMSQSTAENLITTRERLLFNSETNPVSNHTNSFTHIVQRIGYKSSAYSLHARAEEGGIKKQIDAVTDTNFKIIYWRES